MKRDNINFWQLPEYPGIEFLRARYINHSYAPHFHKGYGIGIVEEGVEEFHYLGKDYSASGLSLITVNPNQIHTGHGKGSIGWSTRMAYIDTSYFTDFIGDERRGMDSIPWFEEGVIFDEELVELFKWMHLSMEKSSSRAVKDSMLTNFITYLVTHYASDSHTSGADHFSEQNAVLRAKEYIQAHFYENISVEEISENAYLSTFYLSKVFKRETGISIHKYLNLIRIDKARDLLRSGVTPVTTAVETGFVDQSHFTHWFKRITGVTPSVYRSAYKISKNLQ